MKCNYCGAELINNAKFCGGCGKAVVFAGNEAPTAPVQSVQTGSTTVDMGLGKGTLMGTQVSILVKKESLYSELRWKLMGHPFLWFLYIFRKSSAVQIWIDKGSDHQKYMELAPQKKSYIIDLEPGYHEINFGDENADSKGVAGAFTRVAGGLAAGAFASGLGLNGINAFGDFMDATGGSTIRDGFAAFTLQSGDLYELICKPTAKGGVKVWEQKK